MSKPNPVQVQKFLSGVDYPASRAELVEHAHKQGAEDAVVEALSTPDRTFDGPNAVRQAYA